MNPEELQKHFGTPSIRFLKGAGDFIYAEVANKLATAVISLHGAHLMQFVPAGERPVIWMSEKSFFEAGKPIRGGVPVCWPWFGPADDPALPAHGYARLSGWSVAETADLPDGSTRIVLKLTQSGVDARFAPFAFELEIEFLIGSALVMNLGMTNRSESVQKISDALHSYFAVADSSKIQLKGLDKTPYFDKLTGQEECMQLGDIGIDREVDRIYWNTAAAVEITDPVFNRIIRVEKSGSSTTVVWNPWIAKSERMPDFGNEEYKTMVCVEATNNYTGTLELAPGGRHILTQKISVVGGN